VQFDHRMMAYALLLIALLHAADALRMKTRGPAASGALGLALAVALQAVLGILTLLYQVPTALGLAHQGMALVVLTIASLHAARAASSLRLPPTPAPSPR
jgi:cytochrome c oxidase assembly protein subunit 15